jgi:hypothetical protein
MKVNIREFWSHVDPKRKDMASSEAIVGQALG